MSTVRLSLFSVATMLACACLAKTSHAQVALWPGASLDSDSKLVFLLQGERRQLSKDFIAQLDGDQLKISLESSGLISASPNEELLVALVQPNGVRKQMRPDANGEIVFSDVREGLAAIVVSADSLASTSLTSLYAAIPFFVSSTVAGDLDAAPKTNIPMAEVEPERLARDLNESAGPETNEEEILNSNDFEMSAPSRFRVRRLADGSVQGQVVVPQRGFLEMPGVTNIAFYNDGNVVASTSSNVEGYFVADNVPVGINSLTATGPAGHAAYHVEIMEAPGELVSPLSLNRDALSSKRTKLIAVRNGIDEQRELPIAFQEEVADTLIVCLIPNALMDDVRGVLKDRLPVPVQAAPPVDLAGAPMGGAPAPAPAGLGGASGGYGGGFGGGSGGGGFGGGGGAGALVGLAGLAGVAAIASSDDGGNNNNNFFTPPIASPISPQPAPPAATPPPPPPESEG